MLIRRQGIADNTLTLAQPAPRPCEPQYHQARQRHAVATQTHRLPAPGTAEKLPAASIPAQASDGLSMGQQYASGDHPPGMGQTSD